MADWFVRARATRWVADEPFPGIVEVEIIDASHRTWKFIDKAPIFDSGRILTSGATYPIDLDLACTVVGPPSNGGNEQVVISTAAPWGLESEDGTSEFVVNADQIKSSAGG